MSTVESPGLLFAVNLDGAGGAADIPATAIRSELAGDSLTWVHLDYSAQGIEDWLREVAGLDDVAIEALMVEESRPRCTPHRDGVILILAA